MFCPFCQFQLSAAFAFFILILSEVRHQGVRPSRHVCPKLQSHAHHSWSRPDIPTSPTIKRCCEPVTKSSIARKITGENQGAFFPAFAPAEHKDDTAVTAKDHHGQDPCSRLSSRRILGRGALYFGSSQHSKLIMDGTAGRIRSCL